MNLVLKSTSIYDGVSGAPFAGYIEIEDNRIKNVIKGRQIDTTTRPDTRSETAGTGL